MIVQYTPAQWNDSTCCENASTAGRTRYRVREPRAFTSVRAASGARAIALGLYRLPIFCIPCVLVASMCSWGGGKTAGIMHQVARYGTSLSPLSTINTEQLDRCNTVIPLTHDLIVSQRCFLSRSLSVLGNGHAA